jgi:hypothetical protein
MARLEIAGRTGGSDRRSAAERRRVIAGFTDFRNDRRYGEATERVGVPFHGCMTPKAEMLNLTVSPPPSSGEGLSRSPREGASSIPASRTVTPASRTVNGRTASSITASHGTHVSSPSRQLEIEAHHWGSSVGSCPSFAGIGVISLRASRVVAQDMPRDGPASARAFRGMAQGYG